MKQVLQGDATAAAARSKANSEVATIKVNQTADGASIEQIIEAGQLLLESWAGSPGLSSSFRFSDLLIYKMRDFHWAELDGGKIEVSKSLNNCSINRHTTNNEKLLLFLL